MTFMSKSGEINV